MTTFEIRMERAEYLNKFVQMTEEEGLRCFRLGEFKGTPIQAMMEKYAYLLKEEYNVRL